MKQTNIPAKPDAWQICINEHYLLMDEYWFDVLIKKACRYVESPIIKWEDNEEGKQSPLYAKMYSVDGIDKGTKEPLIYCFFIFYNNRVWKARNSSNAAELVEAIIAVEKWHDYEEKMMDADFEKRQKLKAAKKVKALPKRKKAA
jgi:hypothetical protein